MQSIQIFLVLILCIFGFVGSSPMFLDQLLGMPQGSQGTRERTTRQARRMGRTYNDIARVINPAPYSNPRGSPFPAVPFWHY